MDTSSTPQHGNNKAVTKLGLLSEPGQFPVDSAQSSCCRRPRLSQAMMRVAGCHQSPLESRLEALGTAHAHHICKHNIAAWWRRKADATSLMRSINTILFSSSTNVRIIQLSDAVAL